MRLDVVSLLVGQSLCPFRRLLHPEENYDADDAPKEKNQQQGGIYHAQFLRF
jgi:hypothetical protein